MFQCRYEKCPYQSISFNRLWSYIWDRHKNLSFRHICGISNCTSGYTNLQSFRRHVKCKHKWFFEQHMKFFKSSSAEDACANNDSSEDEVVGCTTTTDDNLNDEVDPLLDTTNHQMSDDVDDGYFDKVDFVKLIGEGLLDLRENFNVTTAATCKISEFIIDILRIERNVFAKATEKSLLRNESRDSSMLNFETKEILNSESPFIQACLKFCGEKVLSNHFKLQKNYIEPVERVVGFDHESDKPDSVQYVLILSSIKTLLQHEDVLGYIYDDQNLQTGIINK